MKYRDLIISLNSDELYTPGSIAQFASDTGYILERTPSEQKQAQQRIRISLGRYSNNHFFPDNGDGMVLIRGQAPTPGWFGWRWQEALEDLRQYRGDRNE